MAPLRDRLPDNRDWTGQFGRHRGTRASSSGRLLLRKWRHMRSSRTSQTTGRGRYAPRGARTDLSYYHANMLYEQIYEELS